MTDVGMSLDELAELEQRVVDALASRDSSRLTVVGFGEISVALGWPPDSPRFACKRTPPSAPHQLAQYEQLVGHYVDQLRSRGAAVVDTEVLSVDRGDRLVGYVVQPLVPEASLGHRVLAAAEPDPEHPLLGALASTLDLVTDRLSIDAQVTNFSWDGTALTLLDVGTPFLWDAAGNLLFDMDPYRPMIPAPLRSFVERDLTRVANRWRDRRHVAVDIVANLLRQGLLEWVEPTTDVLNRALGPGRPIRVDEAMTSYDRDRRTFPRLTRLQRIERAWQTSIRRRPYEFFVNSTYDGATTYS